MDEDADPTKSALSAVAALAAAWPQLHQGMCGLCFVVLWHFILISKGTFTLLSSRCLFSNVCFVFNNIGCSLKSLDLDSCTLSEILRLHILASGADVTSANAKYRYQKRGGFDATDDACMELRLSNPSLVKKLSSTAVYDLTPGKRQDGIFLTYSLPIHLSYPEN